MLDVAVGTASVLGLVGFRQDVKPTTAHLMIPGRCRFDCGYCTQAAGGSVSHFLSRIRWPSFEDGAILRSLSKGEVPFKRICVQAVQTGDWVDQAFRIIDGLVSIGLPISLATRPLSTRMAERFFTAGIDRLGLPLDAASAKIYRRQRAGNFAKDIGLIEEVARDFRGRVTTHIIAGLGEEEADIVNTMVRLRGSGVKVALFAFTPCPGTKMAAKAPPQLSKYRRIQVAHYLIERALDRGFVFNSRGDITDFGYSCQELKRILKPLAFQTSGCPACNRPFYNERPSGTMFNYPRALSDEEFERELHLIGAGGEA
jgi:biotin synthase-related radical SAM superfamily protein